MRHLWKRAFVLFLCFVFGIFLTSCGDSSVQTPTGNTDTSVEVGTSASTISQSSSESETETSVADLVMAHNTITGVFGVYDMALLEPGDFLEEGLVWSCKTGEGGDMKYREDTVFGDVIVTCGSGIGKMISYPEGKVLWETKNPGNNPHAIEILPSGNIVIACSTGNILRLFKTSALLQGESATSISFLDVELRDAHGVLWDPKYDVLWVLGDFELNAYRIVGTGVEERLELCEEMSRPLPENKTGGYALAADLTDPDYLYLTVDSTAFRFDKKEGVFLSDFAGKDRVCRPWVKGLAKNRSGDFVLAVSNGVFRPWCTDTVLYLKKDGDSFLEQQIHLAETRAIYKVAPFCGSYL